MTQTAAPQIITPITDVRTAERLVTAISELAGGGEHYQATALEAQLWEGVLEGIAASNAQAGYLAATALKTKKIVFPRQKLG